MIRLHGEAIAIADECARLNAQALEFLSDARHGQAPKFDGTLASLIRVYQTDAISPFRSVKWATREAYTKLLTVLTNEVGARSLQSLTAYDFHGWYAEFRSPATDGGPERVARAWHLMNMIRAVLTFGIVLEIPHCDRLRAILANMKFQGIAARAPSLTADQVIAIRKAAHAAGRPSVALAQAIQFETALRQKDVIGEWEPAPVASGGPLAHGGKRWTTGLTWGTHIDEHLILTKPTSKSRGKKVMTFDLSRCPMVMEELAHVPRERRVGPVIVSEGTGLPYTPTAFGRMWRRIATAAGVPANVFNMDSRSGALTEAAEAGLPVEQVKKLGGHSQVAMTQRYMRDRATDDIMAARAAHRSQKER